MKPLRDWITYLLARLFFAFIGAIPRWLAYPLCETLAVLVYLVDKKHRHIGLTNLRIAFPEQDDRWRMRILRQSFQQVGDLAVELSRLHRLNAQEVSKRVRYEAELGLVNYRKAAQQGRGILYLTAHISAWELLPVAHALYGHPLSFVVRPLDNPFLERWMTRVRTRCGNQVIPKRHSTLRSLRLLKEGGDVGFLIDQNIQEKEGVFAPFFGKPACTTSALAALALKTSAPVLPGFIYPSGRRGHYTIRFYPSLKAEKTGNYERDLIENTARFNQYIEEVIREYPHCWLWGHRRFRAQPDGNDPYRTDHQSDKLV